MSEQRYCPKCRKTMADTNFYTFKTGEKSDLCKSCETMHINNWDPETFTWLLEKYDVPYIPAEWDVLRDRAYQKDPYKMTGMSVFGKYLSKMRLKKWKDFRYADSEQLQLQEAERAKLYGSPADIAQERLDNMRQAYENGEINEAQYRTYVAANPQEQHFAAVDPTEKEPTIVNITPGNAVTGMPPGFQSSATTVGVSNPYPVNDNPFEQIELVDVGADLDKEDKTYLAMKWGRLYSAADWVYLEQKYNDFMETFDIQGAARLDTLVQICKLSLKMNQALDSGDMDSYSKLVRAYDSLMKSAKFKCGLCNTLLLISRVYI